MTANQIAYAQHLENVRANAAREAETNRSNLANEKETNRHNVATEAHNVNVLGETTRHNIATEDVAKGTLSESIRHNMAYERETNRHNLATEALGNNQLAESIRHNKATENAAYMQASAALQNANTNAIVGGRQYAYYGALTNKLGEEAALIRAQQETEAARERYTNAQTSLTQLQQRTERYRGYATANQINNVMADTILKGYQGRNVDDHNYGQFWNFVSGVFGNAGSSAVSGAASVAGAKIKAKSDRDLAIFKNS